jgi:hypothetical protein
MVLISSLPWYALQSISTHRDYRLLFSLLRQPADIEDLVLSGKLFNGDDGSRSPERRSPNESDGEDEDKGWHDDELASPHDLRANVDGSNQSVGMGTGRTGVKGVIRDRAEVIEMNRMKKEREMEELKRKMEKASLGGKTFLEEEEESEKQLRASERRNGRMDMFGNRRGKFGYLREVGVEGFVGAIEQEERDVWVVIHIYDSVRSFLLFLKDSDLNFF